MIVSFLFNSCFFPILVMYQYQPFIEALENLTVPPTGNVWVIMPELTFDEYCAYYMHYAARPTSLLPGTYQLCWTSADGSWQYVIVTIRDEGNKIFDAESARLLRTLHMEHYRMTSPIRMKPAPEMNGFYEISYSR